MGRRGGGSALPANVPVEEEAGVCHMAALLASSMFVLPMETSYPRRLLSKSWFLAYSPPSSKVAMLLLLMPVTLWAVVSPGLLAFPWFLNRLLSSLQKSMMSSRVPFTLEVPEAAVAEAATNKARSLQLLVSNGGGRRPVDGLRQQPCLHHPTARVGHSRGFHHHIDLMSGRKTIAR